jgi:hypothetical protein
MEFLVLQVQPEQGIGLDYLKDTSLKIVLFKGNTLNMNSHVFKCYEERGDRSQFSKTLEALGEYATKNHKDPDKM